MKWKIPPRIKVHEALGCIGDKRIIVTENEAEVYSSSGNKKYTVRYDPDRMAITANDNGSYWVGYLGYPSIAFLMVKGVIKYDQKYTAALSGINWKDVNQEFKNDFKKTEEYVKEFVKGRGVSVKELDDEIDRIYEKVKRLNLDVLGKKLKPPEGY